MKSCIYLNFRKTWNDVYFKTILTAAHCIRDLPKLPNLDYFIEAGFTKENYNGDLGEHGQKAFVESYAVHPNFSFCKFVWYNIFQPFEPAFKLQPAIRQWKNGPKFWNFAFMKSDHQKTFRKFSIQVESVILRNLLHNT